MRAILCLTALVVYASAHDYVRPDACPDDHINYDRAPGQDNKTFLVEEEDDCALACDDDPDCVAYNVEKRDELQCELADHRAGKYGEYLNTGPGWEYWEKQDDETEYETCNGIYKESPGYQMEIMDSGVTTQHVHRGNDRCWWGKDTFYDDGKVYWTQADHNDAYYVWEYADWASWIADNNKIRHDIDPHGISSQYLVHKRKFWYRERDTRDVIVWDLETDTVAGHVQELFSYKWWYGPYSSQCQMDKGQHSGLDIEADESGVWFIYGMVNYRCWLVIAKIDTDNYKFTGFTEVKTFAYSEGGTGFLADGIYYMTDHYNHNPTFIRYQYNVRNNTWVGISMKESGKRWEQTHGIESQTHYNPVDGLLYSTNYQRHFTIDPVKQKIFNYN